MPQFRHEGFRAVCGGTPGYRKAGVIAMDMSVSAVLAAWAVRRAERALVEELEVTAAGIPNSSLSFTQSLQLMWVLQVNYLPQLRDPSVVSKDMHKLFLDI